MKKKQTATTKSIHRRFYLDFVTMFPLRFFFLYAVFFIVFFPSSSPHSFDHQHKNNIMTTLLAVRTLKFFSNVFIEQKKRRISYINLQGEKRE